MKESKERRNNMAKFVEKPDTDIYEGIIVDKDTKLEYKSDRIEQKIEDLKLYSKITTINERYTSVTDLTINLIDGEPVLFEEERGYFVPSTSMCSIDDSLELFNALKNLIKE